MVRIWDDTTGSIDRSGDRQVPPMESPRLVLQVEAEPPLDPPKVRALGPGLIDGR